LPTNSCVSGSVEYASSVTTANDGYDIVLCNELPDIPNYVRVLINVSDLTPDVACEPGEQVTLLDPEELVTSVQAPQTDTEVLPKELKTRKRKHKTCDHKKVVRKKLRNSGQQYVSSDGTPHPSKAMSSCSCRMQCSDKVSSEHCQNLFSSFWSLADFDKQNAFLFGQIRCFKPKRRRVDDPSDSRKQHSFAFYVKNENGCDIRICKQAFLGIFGLQHNRGRVNNIMTLIASGAGLPKTDGRGKHDHRPNKCPPSTVDCVKAHIASFPQYQSHYSRRDNINRTYLGPELSISKMYDLYCENKDWPSVSSAFYRRIFCEHFNLGFSTPKTDTCKKCESLSVKMKTLSQNSTEYADVHNEYNSHKQTSEKAFTFLRNDSELVKSQPDDVHCIAIDLQQALPTPKLSVGPAFYKRKVMSYNIAVHDCASEESYMFLWPETVAGRGADEVASCILKYVSVADIRAKKLVIYSDNCAGQNKNFRNFLSICIWYVLGSSMKLGILSPYQDTLCCRVTVISALLSDV